MSSEDKSLSLAESHLRRASLKLEEARDHFERGNYPETVTSAYECIDLSVRAMMMLSESAITKKKKFKEKDFSVLYENLPDELKELNIARIYLLFRLWGEMTNLAKYGSETLGAGPEKIFTAQEARFALQHAEESYSTANRILAWYYQQTST